MDTGLYEVGRQASRFVREEFQIIRDEPAYNMVRNYVSEYDMEEIDGWARSYYTLEGHLDAILAYRKPLLPRPTDPVWTDTLNSIKAEFHSFEHVTALSFENGFDYVSYEPSSAAGYGYTGRKSEGNNFARAKSIANAAVRSFEERVQEVGFDQAAYELAENSTPDVGLTRTQLAKLPKIKVRNVFGEAFHYILIEGLSAFPLLSAFKRGDTFYFIGKDPLVYVPALIEELEHNSRWIMVLDWSAFDASVQNWEIDFAFDCLESIITFPTTLSRTAFDYSRVLFKKRKILAPNGVMYMRNSGIPSGSYFTNLVGSIINYTRIKFIMNKQRIPVYKIRVQGDDSITGTNQEQRPNPAEFAMIGDKYGWTLKPEKSIITNYSYEVEFLGRSMRNRYNVRDRLKALRLICFPEYQVDDPSISTARVHAIAKDAGHIDILFDKIYCAMFQLYGEAQTVPQHLLPFFQREEFM